MFRGLKIKTSGILCRFVSCISLRRHKNCRTTIHQKNDGQKLSFTKLPGHDGANTSAVSSSSDHAQIPGIEPDGVLDLTGGDVNLHAVVNLA